MQIRDKRVQQPEPDIKFRRLAISIEKCVTLRQHFFNKEYMEQACDYHGLEFYAAELDTMYAPHTYKIDRFSLAKFLFRLYRMSAQIFVSFLTYVLKDILIAQGNPGSWVTDDKIYLEDFKRDLSAVGYRFDGYKVTPSVSGGEQEEARLLDDLNALLLEINPEFPKMRDGAWEAYLSRSPDSDRQAISSVRELLDHVVGSLSNKKTWREKVAEIVGATDAEVAASLADLVKTLYNLQSKGTHDEPSYERAFFAIKLTEYLLYFLLKSRLNQ